MNKRKKLQEGKKVKYKGMEWVVCKGGYHDPDKKSHMYKLARGAWKRFVAGNCITA